VRSGMGVSTERLEMAHSQRRKRAGRSLAHPRLWPEAEARMDMSTSLDGFVPFELIASPSRDGRRYDEG
jgi:hypothetical protein